MSYTPPQTIIEAKIRMLQKQVFTPCEGSSKTFYANFQGDFFSKFADVVSGKETISRMNYEDFSDCKNWLPYKEPEPEFPFQFDELACVRDDHGLEWHSAKFSHVPKNEAFKNFRVIGGKIYAEITTFFHDLLGKVCEPTTLVWIVRDGKPCVKS